MREYSISKIRKLELGIPRNFADALKEMGVANTYLKGDLIYHQGDVADCIYFLIKGRAKVTLISSSGQVSILRIHLSHSILGLTALASDPIRDASATCMDPVSLVFLPRADFQHLMHREPSFAIYIVCLLTDRMSDFHYRVGDWLTQTVEQRLTQALLGLSAPDTSDVGAGIQEIPLTHEELAQVINTRRPTVSRLISKLADLNLVNQSGRTLVVLDGDRLAAHASRNLD